MTLSQQFALDRHNLTKHSTYKGAVICKSADGWAIIWEDGSTDFHIHSLAVAKAEISATY